MQIWRNTPLYPGAALSDRTANQTVAADAPQLGQAGFANGSACAAITPLLDSDDINACSVHSASWAGGRLDVAHHIKHWLLKLRDIPKACISSDAPPSSSSSIKKLLGDDWSKLHPHVQKRFATEPALTERVFYRGQMERVECSLAGKIFAHFTKLIANPLTPYEGENVCMDVVLYRKRGLAGVYWRRTYYFDGRTPFTVTSVKRLDRKGRLTECVGAGFGMMLNVKVENQGLHFRSSHYFWQMGKFRLPIPHMLTPGETHVVHENLHNGLFRFTIAMTHPYLGRTFYQTGIFKEIIENLPPRDIVQ